MILRPLAEIDTDIVNALTNNDIKTALKFVEEREHALRLLKLKRGIKPVKITKKTGKRKNGKVDPQGAIDEVMIYNKAVKIINDSTSPIRQCVLFPFLAAMFENTVYVKYWASKGHDCSVTLHKRLVESTEINTFKDGAKRFFAAKN